MRAQRVVGPERYDLEETTRRKTLDEQFESLLGHIHFLAIHGPTAVDQEYKHRLLLDLSRYIYRIDVLWFFILNDLNLFLRLGWDKGGNKRHHNRDQILVGRVYLGQ